jgi:CBS domain-containing protein
MPSAADVMTSAVISVTPDTPVTEIAKILFGHHISGAPVVDTNGRLVGIVSEGDLMSHVGAVGSETPRRSWWLGMFTDSASLAADYSRTHARTAGDIMSTELVTVREDTPLRDVARLLEKKRIKRVPVMRNDKLVGIVTRANLVQALASMPPAPPASSDDKAIAEGLSSEMAAQSWGTFVNAIVEDGVVHLWGFVSSGEEHRALLLLAKNIPGVKGVEDHLAARPSYGAY